VRSNGSLQELSATVQYVGGLYIENNISFTTIKLPCLEEVTMDLNIDGNCALLCLDNFDELRRVGGAILIADNKQLVEIKGFSKLKYIGSICAQNSGANPTPNCGTCINTCFPSATFDWATGIVVDATTCTITSIFDHNFYDASFLDCPYILPNDFFLQLCNPISTGANACLSVLSSPTSGELAAPGAVSYSLIIFRNPRLRAIGGFCNLKQVNSNIYIINNAVLNTIAAFGQLAVALDVWIRNNPLLKFIIGFINLLSVRDFVVLETAGLRELNALKSLEFAQDIAIEAYSIKSVKFGPNPIPTVLGYVSYFNFSTTCGC